MATNARRRTNTHARYRDRLIAYAPKEMSASSPTPGRAQQNRVGAGSRRTAVRALEKQKKSRRRGSRNKVYWRKSQEIERKRNRKGSTDFAMGVFAEHSRKARMKTRRPTCLFCLSAQGAPSLAGRRHVATFWPGLRCVCRPGVPARESAAISGASPATAAEFTSTHATGFARTVRRK